MTRVPPRTLFKFILAVALIQFTTVGDAQHSRETETTCNGDSHTYPINGSKLVCHVGLWSADAHQGAFSGDVLDPFLCTHYVVSYFTIDRNQNKWSLLPPLTDVQKEVMEKVFDLKKINPDLKLLIAIGGYVDNRDDTSKYFNLTSDDSNTRRFVADTFKYFENNPLLDGIDFQWNYPGRHPDSSAEVDREALATFTTRTCSLLRARGYLCMITLQRPEHRIEDLKRTQNAFATIIREADLVVLWTADIPPEPTAFKDIFHTDLLYNPPRETPNYDLIANYSVQTMVEMFTNGVLNPTDLSSRNKLLLTIPMQANSFNIKEYSKTWTDSWPQRGTNPDNVPPPPNFGSSTNLGYETGLEQIPFFQVCRQVRLLSNHDNRKYFLHSHYNQNGVKSAPVAYNKERLVPTNTPESVRDKVQYAKQMKLGGVSVFQLGADDVNGWCYNQTYPLLNTIFDELNKPN